MNHNPNNVKVGDWVKLDKNDEPVKVFYQTPMGMVSIIGNHETEIDTWQVMTDRLKPLSMKQIYEASKQLRNEK